MAVWSRFRWVDVLKPVLTNRLHQKRRIFLRLLYSDSNRNQIVGAKLLLSSFISAPIAISTWFVKQQYFHTFGGRWRGLSVDSSKGFLLSRHLTFLNTSLPKTSRLILSYVFISASCEANRSGDVKSTCSTGINDDLRSPDIPLVRMCAQGRDICAEGYDGDPKTATNSKNIANEGGGDIKSPSLCTCEIECSQSPACNNVSPSSSGSHRSNKNQMGWQENDCCDLSHKVLVRQACQLVVDSTTRLITEIIATYQDYNEQYRCLLDSYMETLEMSRIAVGSTLEQVDCKLIQLKSEIAEIKNQITELETFMCSIQRLADSAAETAFLGHAEYSSLAMSERVQSAAREMMQIKEESLRKERDMIELQSVVIVESGQGLK